MATVTGLTAIRMLAIEAASVVSGLVDASSHLILTKQGGGQIDAGYVKGNTGAIGPAGPQITGVIAEFAGSVAPSGSALCNGQALSRTVEARLFAVIGTVYGVGDGTTTFNLPNRNGRVGVGLDSTQTEFNALGKTGGGKTHQHTMVGVTVTAHTHTGSWALPTHVHVINAHTHPLSGAGQAAVDFEGNSAFIGRTPVPMLSNIMFTTAATTADGGVARGNSAQLQGRTENNAEFWSDGRTGAATVAGTTSVASANTLSGSSDAASSLPPYIVLNYIIYT